MTLFGLLRLLIDLFAHCGLFFCGFNFDQKTSTCTKICAQCMLFNSLDFVVFFLVVFLVYWFVANRDLRLQNAFLLLASYFFYGWWDYRFLILLAFSTGLDYAMGQKISESVGKTRKMWLWISVAVNLGFLGFFKY